MELSALAANIRFLIKGLGYAFLCLFLIWLIWLFLSFSFQILFPEPPEEADLAFGKLPKPFTIQAPTSSIEFYLETPGERFPNVPNILAVFFIPPLEGRFTSLDNGSQIARGAGLNSEPVKLNEPFWRWSNSLNPHQSLKLNVVTNNFVYSYDWVADPSSLNGVFKTTDADIINEARSYLTNFRSLKEDFKDGDNKVSYWKLDGLNRTKVGSLSEANAVLVEFFRKKIQYKGKEYQLSEGNINLAAVNVLISPSDKLDKKLLEINFTYWEVDLSNFGTYTLRKPEQAFEDLKKGQCYVASFNLSKFKTVRISRIYLAYLNPIKETRFLQPVYVFEGDGKTSDGEEKFVAYVPAISSDHLK